MGSTTKLVLTEEDALVIKNPGRLDDPDAVFATFPLRGHGGLSDAVKWQLKQNLIPAGRRVAVLRSNEDGRLANEEYLSRADIYQDNNENRFFIEDFYTAAQAANTYVENFGPIRTISILTQPEPGIILFDSDHASNVLKNTSQNNNVLWLNFAYNPSDYEHGGSMQTVNRNFEYVREGIFKGLYDVLQLREKVYNFSPFWHGGQVFTSLQDPSNKFQVIRRGRMPHLAVSFYIKTSPHQAFPEEAVQWLHQYIFRNQINVKGMLYRNDEPIPDYIYNF